MHPIWSASLDVSPGADDEVDSLFQRASPNPERLDCPGREVLEQLATRSLPIEHNGYHHLAQCSPCYREFRTIASDARATAIAARRG